jgi:hypothetical protein
MKTTMPARGMWKITLALPLLALAGMGCSSYRINTDLSPAKTPVPIAETMKFHITEARYVISTNTTESGLAPFGVMNIAPEELQRRLMASAVLAYPRVFSRAEDAVPLSVTITREEDQSDINPAGACVSCLTLTILPLRTADTIGFTVQVSSPDERVPAAVARPVVFQRTEIMSLSMFPTGWIPVVGGEGERIMGTDAALRKGGELTLNAVVEAVAVALRRPRPDNAGGE